MRLLWTISGLFAFVVGTIGVFVPLLPTVSLMILAAFCFGKSSPRLHRWLLEHPTYGPHIRDWQASGAIHPNAKRLATLSIVVAFAISLALGLGVRILMVQAVILLSVLVFIWTRPPA